MSSAEDASEDRANILIVDDRAENLIALEAVLQPLGQRIVSATSGSDALRHLLAEEFAVVLLDVFMPGMDGFETATLIRGRARSQHLPIIFLTAVSQQEEAMRRGYDVGAVDYIQKPFLPAVLRAKVAVFVELHKKNAQIRRQTELLRIAERREREEALHEAQRESNRRYEGLAESMPQIVWTAGPDGRLAYSNRRWRDYVGDVAAESTAVHPDDRDAVERAWRDARAAEADFEVAMRLRRARDGAYRWHLARANAVRNAAGELTEWIGTSTDIHDQMRDERALQLLADASVKLAESIDLAQTLPAVARRAVPGVADWCSIHLVDASGALRRLAFVGPTRERTEAAAATSEGFFAPPAEPLSGTPAELVIDAAPGSGIVTWVRAPLLLRQRVRGELRLGTEEGRRLDETDVARVVDLAQRISTAIDTSEAYELAQRERAAVEAASRLKDDFLAVLSHELRTPLNTTLGWAQMLRTGELDERTTAVAIETIERSARTQARLVDDLLDVSAIVTGKLRLRIGQIDVAAAVAAAVETVRVAAETKGVAVVIDVPAGLPPIRGDAARFQQIVWNLLTNAVKFGAKGNTVHLRAERGAERTTITVEDDGPGIAPAFLPHVFDRFRQANSSITRSHGGLGLGLSIVRHLTELHGGTCRAESSGLGSGARFVIELPNGPDGAPGAAPVLERPVLDDLRVLLVEDVADARVLIQAILERAGARVRSVGDADEALAALDAERPDILISDVGLPRIDGYELVRRVRASEGGKHPLPAIALTAYATKADRRAALKAGFQAHVVKPIDEQVLLGEIGRLTRRTH